MNEYTRNLSIFYRLGDVPVSDRIVGALGRKIFKKMAVMANTDGSGN